MGKSDDDSKVAGNVNHDATIEQAWIIDFSFTKNLILASKRKILIFF